jgi:hypothetical protein
MAAIYIPTSVHGLMQELADGIYRPFPGPAVGTGFRIGYQGQTANTSGSNVPNQQIGTVSIPSGTADGAVITVPNTLVTASSLIFLQVKGSSGKKLMLDAIVCNTGVSFTFTVRTADAAATTAACDVHYLIYN